MSGMMGTSVYSTWIEGLPLVGMCRSAYAELTHGCPCGFQGLGVRNPPTSPEPRSRNWLQPNAPSLATVAPEKEAVLPQPAPATSLLAWVRRDTGDTKMSVEASTLDYNESLSLSAHGPWHRSGALVACVHDGSPKALLQCRVMPWCACILV